jgi:hypothetical protein
MKLLLYLECGDVRKLQMGEGVKCECGESGGRYLDDGLRADVWGDCAVIGLDNPQLCRVLDLHERAPGENLSLAAWVFGFPTRNITKTK